MTTPPDPAPKPVEAEKPPAGEVRYGRTMMLGSLWMIASRWAMRLIGLVSTMILARLLAPDDFGLIAMVMLAYGLLETISYAGVDLALMRPGADARDYYDTAWTVQVLQGLFMALCLVLAAPFVASYFDEPRALTVMYWVSVRAIVDSLANIGVVAFRKELDFAKEFRFTLYNKLVNFVVVVAAGWWFRNYWALVFGTLVASVVGVAVSYAMHPFRPRLSLARVREIWSFSQWLMISRIGAFLNRKCDSFIVGGHAGAGAMGSYHVANELATLPTSEIVMPVRRAMFPTLSKMAGRGDAFASAVLDSFSGVAAVCLFIGSCLFVLAPEVVSVVLGSKWGDAAPLIRWMAVFGSFSALVLVLEVPLWVSGKTNVSAAQTWLELAAIIPATLLAVRSHGVEGAAAARAGVSVAMVPIMMMLTARSGSLTFRALFAALWRPLAAAAASTAVMSLAVPAIQAPALLLLLVKGSLCVLLYLGAMALLWLAAGRPAGIESSVLTQAAAWWARRRAT